MAIYSINLINTSKKFAFVLIAIWSFFAIADIYFIKIEIMPEINLIFIVLFGITIITYILGKMYLKN